MKKLLLAAAALLSIVCCSKKAQVHPEWTYDSVVYEVNVRQFSPEGTFKGVEAQLPRLKDLGVDILWLMPMYKIGEQERKGTLGSYYAISDYCAVNPEFGTMEDFESLLAEAHKLGFKVILDWVANQTAPDNVWMTTKPADFYERDSLGNAIWEYDWTDTRSLNYENEDVWWAQDEAMRFWLEKGVDGFRCDAAGEVPAEFWYGILPKMNKDYPDIYLLAEAERDNLADATETFDANYAWELHHLLNGLAQGSKTVQDLKDYIERDAARFPREAFRLTFTSNHDENSWSGTEFEREGAAADACAVLCFTLPGSQPLIYTGQEIGLDRRLAFFEKDPITDWSPNEHTEFWKKLIDMKHRLRALDAGEKGGPIEFIDAPEGVIAFSREVKGSKVVVAANFGDPSNSEPLDWGGTMAGDNRPQGVKVVVPFLNLESEPVDVTLPLDGTYREQFTGAFYKGNVTVTLAPGEYIVLAK
ncbi:MAG: alpha-amylase [Bacteroidales bacterium]|nr:alpha-amylase [Bacteroidales bacterium]